MNVICDDNYKLILYYATIDTLMECRLVSKKFKSMADDGMAVIMRLANHIDSSHVLLFVCRFYILCDLDDVNITNAITSSIEKRTKTIDEYYCRLIYHMIEITFRKKTFHSQCGYYIIDLIKIIFRSYSKERLSKADRHILTVYLSQIIHHISNDLRLLQIAYDFACKFLAGEKYQGAAVSVVQMEELGILKDNLLLKLTLCKHSMQN